MDLEECCHCLESSKVTDRSKSIKQITSLLQKEETIEKINNGETCSWDSIIFSTYVCVLRDAEKYTEDIKKKNSSTVMCLQNGQIFFDVITIAIKESTNLDFSKIFSYLRKFLEQSKMKVCYGKSSVTSLRDSILTSSRFGSHLTANDWTDLFSLLKELCRSRQLLEEYNYAQVECLVLLMKWGPLYSLPPGTLREEFPFISELCQNIASDSSITFKEAILKLVLQFYHHTAKDNRMACCKLGEELVTHLIQLYEISTREDRLKIQLIDFFLLLVILHNPKGVQEGHNGAYAYNLQEWKKFLRSIYWIMCEDIDLNLKCKNKSVSLFINIEHNQQLYQNFVNLFVEVSRQVLNDTDIDVSMAPTSSFRQTKRLKSEINMVNLINRIAETKKWPWIQITSSLLEAYPDMITESEYLSLLQILNNLQKEYKDHEPRYHLYKCLLVLENIKSKVFKSPYNVAETQKLWLSVGEAALKEVSLNLSTEETENLLQKLLANQSIFQPETVLEILSTCSNLSKSKLKLLFVYGQSYNFPKFENNSIKSKIITSILNNGNLKSQNYISSTLTAKVLISLILKGWPFKDDILLNEGTLNRPFSDIADIYLKTSFVDTLALNTCSLTDNSIIDIPSIDIGAKMLLIGISDAFAKSNFHEFEIEEILNISILYKNLLEYLTRYEILSEDEMLNFASVLKKLINQFFESFSAYSEKPNDIAKKQIISNLNIFYKFIDGHHSSLIIDHILSLISSPFLRQLFEIMNSYQFTSSRNFSSKDIKFQLLQNIMRVLCKYCFISSVGTLTPTQLHVFEAIIGFDFDVTLDYQYSLAKIFLHEFKKSKPGCLAESSIHTLLDLLKNICSSRYSLYESALEILSCLKTVLLHALVVQSESCISYLTSLLVPFYIRRNNYGPEVSVYIIDCLELLVELDKNHGFTKWTDDEEIIISVAHFLCSDFQEVRFRAVVSIVKFLSLKGGDSEVHNVQKTVFKKIFQLNLQVFEIQGNISDERRVDETVTRSASVLHTFASLIISNSSWSQEALFSLLRIAHMKKLTGLQNIFSLILENTKNNHLLENNLEYLLEKWLLYGLKLDMFPINLYKCNNQLDFCKKYFDTVTPFLLENDLNTLKVVGESVGKTHIGIISEFCPKIIGNALCEGDLKDVKKVLVTNRTLKYLVETLTIGTFKQIINDNIEMVITYLILAISDETDFERTFNNTVKYFSPGSRNITISKFQEALLFLENDMCNTPNLLASLVSNKPYKLNKVTLEVKQKIEKMQFDKLRIFHGYFTITNLITEQITENTAYCCYFIRDTVSYYLNLMEHSGELSVVTSQGFYLFMKQILPKFHTSILPLFHIIVNKLNNMVVCNEKISNICINTLNMIIIENSDRFASSIETLDPFPQDIKFQALTSIYNNFRHKDKNITLEKDIEYFLKCGYETKLSDMREEGLKHLTQQLSMKKQELKEIYTKLRETRRFSEDCEKSLLHQLVYMLVKLTHSKHVNVAVEACRCLGELGPSNLSTLILQPEKPLKFKDLSPSEIFCGQVISRLLLYITDSNIELVAASNDSLVHIMESKEGKKISKSKEDFGFGIVDMKYLIPFLSSGKQKSDNQTHINENTFVTKLNNEALWAPNEEMCHSDWITKLTCCLLESFSDKCYMKCLIQVCKLKSDFGEEILPYLLQFVITATKTHLKNLIFSQIRYFFEQHWVLTANGTSDLENTEIPVLNRSSVRCMLKCIHYIRLQKNYELTPRRMLSESLDLDYLHLAKAAHFCMQHFTAILYAELWCQEKFDTLNIKTSQQCVSYKMLDLIYENVDVNIQRSLENILRDSYKALGELDALSGCGISILLDPMRRVEHYKELGRWEQAILHHEIEMSNNKNSCKELTDSLKHCSLYKLPLLCDASGEPEYECLWRLNQFNIEELKRNDNARIEDHFEKFRYFALKSLHDNDHFCFRNVIKKARVLEIEKIKHTSLGSCKNIYDILARLQALRELENVADKKFKGDDITELLETWKLQDDIVQNEFCYIEPIKQQRIIIVKNVSSNSEYFSMTLPELLLNLCEYARNEGYLNVASRTLGNIHFLENLCPDMELRIKFQDAQLCWSLNDKKSAHHLLRQICNLKKIDPRIKSSALKQIGKWFIESSSENKHTIISDYLLESLKIYTTISRTPEDEKNIIDTYDQLGRFADKEYQQVLSHIKSEMFQQKIKNMEKSKQMANEIKNIIKRRKLTTDESRALRIHEFQSLIDQTEIENTEKEKSVLLKYALRYYLINLAMTNENNIHIFRVFSLFLDNRNNPDIADIINTYLQKVPTYKYITILPQILPHLTNSSDNIFNEQINRIIQKCAEDHPHHTLPLILNLANSNKDREFSNCKTVTSVNDARIASASNLLKKLKKNKRLHSIITKMELLSSAIIELAYYKPSSVQKDNKDIKIPENLRIRKIKDFSDILLPTCNLPVSKECSYQNLIGIHSFGDKYQNVGGINAPKRISCKGTDGKVRSQLVKGHDDLRQDAVMQQVFSIINSLLSSNKNTKNLVIRTYKIVPLSMRSGILEWVDNSIPLGVYLVGDEKEPGGAHVTFRPQDKRPSDCRRMFKDAAGSSAENKLKVFTSICEVFKPVFHKFFENSFPEPSVWYERRRAYTYSVATSSMCGYILGLGDRHVQNILIDKGTAEVIHIDFGIAFEQGRVLPTPETVPFRLTRDIVDGMGVSGPEGIFRKSCEKTMEVMRQNSQTILTILEVLLYDPLYTWTVTTAEANKRQTDRQDDIDGDINNSPSESDTNTAAERALLRLKTKLHGTENGYPVSVEHQVGILIQQAQDPMNLCKLFQGWQPYL